MPTTYRCLPPLLGLCLLLLASFGSRAQTINVDAATRYWEITDALRRNEPLTDQEWRDFLALPDNKTYVASVFDDEDLVRYRRALEVVYMPRYDSLRQVRLKAKSWYYLLINDYKEREQEYQAYVAQTVQSPASLDLMYTYAYAYLPARNRTRLADLKIYYGVLGNDATSQQAGLFYSLRAALDVNRLKPGILEGHEMHHRLNPGRDFGTLAAADEGLVKILVHTQLEGIADLIDKTLEVQTPGDPLGIRAWGLDPAPTCLQRLDSTIQSQARGGAPGSLKFYRRLSGGSYGHVPGFYMASIIERNGYAQPMIAAVGDPFVFVKLYQKAAKKDATHPPRFSDATVRYLRQLDRAYAKPRVAPPTGQ